MLQIVIPMAGTGTRFRERGYVPPKPLLPVFGRAMIARVSENLAINEPSQLNVVYNSAAVAESELRAELGDAPILVPITRMTEGAALTVLCALESIGSSDELVIANSDQLVRFDFAEFLSEARARKADGSILTFRADDRRWSYAQTGSDGWVQRVAEKEVISENATVGIYYFRACGVYREAVEQMVEHNDRVLGEFYVAPVYNWLIKTGGKVAVYHLDGQRGEMHGLGTPDDYEKFLRRDPFRMGSQS